MDSTIVTTLVAGFGVTLLAYVFHKFGVRDHAQRVIVFVLSMNAAIAQLLITHKLSLSSDPATWFAVVLMVQGAAQTFYGIIAAGLKWGSSTTDTPNPT